MNDQQPAPELPDSMSKSSAPMWIGIIVIVALLIAGASYALLGRDDAEDADDAQEGYTIFDNAEDAEMMEGETETDDAMMEDEDAVAEDDETMMGPGKESAPATTGDSSADQAAVKTFELTGRPFSFSQKEIRVNQGDTVRIVFTSTEGMHDWVVDEFDAATERVNAGKTTEVTFVASQAGSFEYYCSVGNHRQQGMVGTLIVQ
jgi:plastocyanin